MKVKELPSHLKPMFSLDYVKKSIQRGLDNYHAKYIQTSSVEPLYHVCFGGMIFSYLVALPEERRHLEHQQHGGHWLIRSRLIFPAWYLIELYLVMPFKFFIFGDWAAGLRVVYVLFKEQLEFEGFPISIFSRNFLNSFPLSELDLFSLHCQSYPGIFVYCQSIMMFYYVSLCVPYELEQCASACPFIPWHFSHLHVESTLCYLIWEWLLPVVHWTYKIAIDWLEG